jgi:hypothetical protein
MIIFLRFPSDPDGGHFCPSGNVSHCPFTPLKKQKVTLKSLKLVDFLVRYLIVIDNLVSSTCNF